MDTDKLIVDNNLHSSVAFNVMENQFYLSPICINFQSHLYQGKGALNKSEKVWPFAKPPPFGFFGEKS